ncbi:uncharacterized protein LOC108606010 [Drosophila busckii]|uniref:uncharacterized protein LOC108606010 n=1 Tax=Drosophila busckii TaxID=30019 RepID=UPI00083F0E24|nr:uncharacterized protein LOC108606010 [Drosophila busckii]
MNPMRQMRQLQLRITRLAQPELHWGPNEEQRHEYDRFIPTLVAAHLQNENPMEVERFVQNLRIILQRQRVHFDVGDGDGNHVWSWASPARLQDQDGGGDHLRTRHRMHLPPMLPPMLPPGAPRLPAAPRLRDDRRRADA